MVKGCKEKEGRPVAKEISSAAVPSQFPRALREGRGSSREGKEGDELAAGSQCVGRSSSGAVL